MAADCRSSDAESGEYWDSTTAVKIAKNGSIIYGVAGDTAITDHILYTWQPPEPATKDPFLHIQTALLPSLNEHVGDMEGEWAMLIGYNQTLFSILSKAAIHSDKPYASIGSGSHFALGALAAGATARYAVQIASMHDMFTSFNTITLSLGTWADERTRPEQ